MYIPIQLIEESDQGALFAFHVEDVGWYHFTVNRRSGRGEFEDEELMGQRGLESHFFRAVDRIQDQWLRGRTIQRTCYAG